MDFDSLLKSKKKTCTPERLIKTLSAIAVLGITSEGEGGRTAYYGDDYEVGTGLRAPDMPFYYKPRGSRQAVLKHLEDNGLITVKDHSVDGWEGLAVTDLGRKLLKGHVCKDCGTNFEWYHSQGFYQSGPRSGFRTDQRIMLCQCKKEGFLKMCAGSANTNHTRALGKMIEPKTEEVPQ